jgi:hypothetical protein
MSKQETSNGSGLSRRDFLKTAAAGAVGAAAVGALGACTTTPAEAGGIEGGLMTEAGYRNLKWSFEVPPDPIPDSQIKEVITSDIIVIGAGMSGLCTACAALDALPASQRGADKVKLFSASTIPYSRGGSNHAIGSKYQKSKGIEYSPETAARHIIKTQQTAAAYFVDKQMWERWINNSAESSDWMIDKMAAKGLKVCLEPGWEDPDGVIDTPPASHNFYTAEQPMGALFGAPMQAQAYAGHIEDMGSPIDYRTKALYLIRDDNNKGRVSAVVAQRMDSGEYVKYVGRKAIVLATGDFSRDPDMMAKYSPWAWENFKHKLSTRIDYDAGLVYEGLMPGDGQKMGLWIGAAWQKSFPNAPMFNLGVGGPNPQPIANFWGINLDINGKRFHNEITNFHYGAAAMQHLPKKTAFGIWDVNYFNDEDQWMPFGYCVDGENGIPFQTRAEAVASWDQAMFGPPYLKANTLEELVAQFDVSEEARKNMLDSIARYNKYVDQKRDEEFHVNPRYLYPIKTAPFYASVNVDNQTFLTVCGGLRTNAQLQVCDAGDNPISGLYNTGIMVGDFYANTYNFVMPGTNLGALCGTLSYLLGRDLVAL